MNDAASLAEFLRPDETAADLLHRVSAEPLHTGIAFIDRRVRLRPNHLALISGTSTAKTELLVQVGCVSEHVSKSQSTRHVLIRI